jgi:serine/threonine-protein kinase
MSANRGIAVVVAMFVAAATTALAQPTDAVKRADALFQEGRTLIEAGKFAEACPKFEESQRLDPGLGTLLNLAACYEQVGKLASALTAFRSAEEQARAAGPSERKREQTAADRARAIESRVARLTIILAAADRPTGFSVTRDGVPVPPLDFGRRIPVDPGTIVIEATAPGYEPFKSEVVIARDTTARTVDIPALDRIGARGPIVGVPQAPPDGDDGVANGGGEITPPRSSRKTIAIGVGVAGIVGLGAGIGLGVSAKGQYDDIPCTATAPPTGCTPDEVSRIDKARSRGNLGTIVGGVGVVALAAGVVLYVTAPKARAVAITPVVGDQEAGVAVVGRF